MEPHGICTNRTFDYLMGFYVGKYIHSIGPSGLGQVTLEFLGINTRQKKYQGKPRKKQSKQFFSMISSLIFFEGGELEHRDVAMFTHWKVKELAG